MSQIRHIRLLNGDEIFGEILLESDKSITIQSPLVAADHINQDGMEVIALVPYLPFSEEDNDVCEISCDKIITYCSVHEIVEEHYRLSLHMCDKAYNQQLMKIAEVNRFMQESMMLDEMNDQDLISVSIH